MHHWFKFLRFLTFILVLLFSSPFFDTYGSIEENKKEWKQPEEKRILHQINGLV